MKRRLAATGRTVLSSLIKPTAGFQSIRIRKGDVMSWFRQVFGFDEPKRYGDVRSCFRVEESSQGEIILKTIPPDGESTTREFYVGKFETPSVSELRGRLKQALQSVDPGSDSSKGGLTFCHIVGDVGELHRNPANKGAVFQAASQFNCLEMTSPDVPPEAGITDYAFDRTQGPVCAMACPAATLYRNYFVNGEGQGGQGKQLDLLNDAGEILGNGENKYWTMENGYAMPTSTRAIQKLQEFMESDPVNTNAARAKLRVGVHWETAVDRADHNVTQVYCSALPIGYSPVPPKFWEPFARMVLDGLYEATLGVAAIIAHNRNERVPVYLTMVGGGVFQNDDGWIANAISRACEIHKDDPIDVILVHYGRIDAKYLQTLPESSR